MSHSIGVHFCVQAAEELAKDGISCEIINLRSIRPLDIDTVNESLKKTHHLMTVEGIIKSIIKTCGITLPPQPKMEIIILPIL